MFIKDYVLLLFKFIRYHGTITRYLYFVCKFSFYYKYYHFLLLELQQQHLRNSLTNLQVMMMTRIPKTAMVTTMTTLVCGQAVSSQCPGSSQCSQALLQLRQSALALASTGLAMSGVERNVRMFSVTQGKSFVMVTLWRDNGRRLTLTWPARHWVAVNLTWRVKLEGWRGRRIRID